MRARVFILTCMAFWIGSATSWGEDLTVSGKENSGCLNRTRADGEKDMRTIVLTREGTVLTVQLLNYTANCGTVDFDIKTTVTSGEDGTPPNVQIQVFENTPAAMDCICPYNVTFTVQDFQNDRFYLTCWWFQGDVELKEGVPLVLEDAKEQVILDGATFIVHKALHQAMLTDGRTVEGNYVIPQEITHQGKSYAVTCLSDLAFRDNTTLRSITISRTIKGMSLEYMDGLTANPFTGCTALQNIVVEEGNQVVCSEDGVLFSHDKKKLISYPAASDRTVYAVPQSVTWVQGEAFSYSQNLNRVELHDGVTTLGYHAFRESRRLAYVRLSKGTQVLAMNTFMNCKALKSVEMQEGMTFIAENAFMGCSNLTSIVIPKTVETIENRAFLDCKSLRDVVLSHGLKDLGLEAFRGCSALREVDVPASVNRIWARAFYGCAPGKLTIRGVIAPNFMKNSMFDGLDRHTVLYVLPSELEAFSAIYPGPLCALQDNDQPNGITMPENEVTEDGEIYDLQGRHVLGRPSRGIYIRQGRLIVVP